LFLDEFLIWDMDSPSRRFRIRFFYQQFIRIHVVPFKSFVDLLPPNDVETLKDWSHGGMEPKALAFVKVKIPNSLKDPLGAKNIPNCSLKHFRGPACDA
jgi:hypothetical protein